MLIVIESAPRSLPGENGGLSTRIAGSASWSFASQRAEMKGLEDGRTMLNDMLSPFSLALMLGATTPRTKLEQSPTQLRSDLLDCRLSLVSKLGTGR
jgi:hypothetical protein